MRTLKCALVLGLALGFSSCKKQTATEEPPEEPVATATPTPKPVTPQPQSTALATPSPVATPAPTPELAPPGVYFLVAAVSVETSDGIIGLKPGQRLQQVRPDVYRADGNEVTLRPAQVTNDLTVARRLASQEQSKQAAIQQRLAAPPTQMPPTQVPPSAGAGPTTPPPSQAPAAQDREAKQAARKAILVQLETVRTQISTLSANLDQASAHFGSWAAASRKSPQVQLLAKQYESLQKRKTELEMQLTQIH